MREGNFERQSHPQELSENDTGLWNSMPKIEEFAAEESSLVYEGNFGEVIKRFEGMNPEQRDTAILTADVEIGQNLKLLIDQMGASEDLGSTDHANKCDKSIDTLIEFQKQLLNLYEGKE